MMLHRVAAVVVLLGAVTLLQIHGIAFWVGQIGIVGAAWSIMMEIAALYFWYHRIALLGWTLGLLASVLVLLGPLAHVSEPLVEELVTAPREEASRQEQIARLQDDRERLRESIAIRNENSRERTGWLPSINRAEEELREVNERLRELQSEPPRDAMAPFKMGVTVMLLAGLVLFQVSVVVAARQLRRQRLEARPAPQEPPAPERAETAGPAPAPAPVEAAASVEPTEGPEEDAALSIDPDLSPEEDRALGRGPYTLTRIRRLASRLDETLQATGESAYAWTQRKGISRRDATWLRQHEERARAGERTISEQALQRIEVALS